MVKIVCHICFIVALCFQYFTNTQNNLLYHKSQQIFIVSRVNRTLFQALKFKKNQICILESFKLLILVVKKNYLDFYISVQILGFDLDLKESIELVMLEYIYEKEMKLLRNSAGNLLRNEHFVQVVFFNQEKNIKEFYH